MKKGISLIVLVITIIVMIILAASVVITLSNTGVINRASEAVDATNQSQVQDLAALIWADAYMDNLRGEDLVEEVETKLLQQGITSDKWNISVTDTGVTVTSKNSSSTTLGSLIKGPEDYGKTVDYTVTVDGTTHTDWQIYYHNAEYVYLIAKNKIGDSKLDKKLPVASLTNAEKELYDKFRVGSWPKYTLKDDFVDPEFGAYDVYSSQAVVQLIKDYANFANTTVYGANVVGAIGSPTVELFVAGWNAKIGTPVMTLTTGMHGYYINNGAYVEVTPDGLYVSTDYNYWMASPAAEGDYVMAAGYLGGGEYGQIYDGVGQSHDVRPVVCLKSSIPATVGTTTDFSLIK